MHSSALYLCYSNHILWLLLQPHPTTLQPHPTTVTCVTLLVLLQPHSFQRDQIILGVLEQVQVPAKITALPNQSVTINLQCGTLQRGHQIT